MTASLLISPWVVDKLGVQLTFSISLVLFAIGSLISTFSPNLPVIIFGRVVQGFGSGVMQPLVMMALVQAFPPERRGMAMGIFSLGIVCAHGVGPYMGGLTIDAFHWRFIFLLPLPIVVFAFVMGLLFLPSRVRGTNASFDWLGFALLSVSIFCMMTVIANGQRDGWFSDSILVTFLISLTTSTAFIITQIYGKTRMMEMALFRYIPFAAAIAISLVYGLVNFLGDISLSDFWAARSGIHPICSRFPDIAGGIVCGSHPAVHGTFRGRGTPPVRNRLGSYPLRHQQYYSGLIRHQHDVLDYCDADCLGRIGLAFMTPSMMSASLNTVPPEKIGEASAIVNFMMLFGGAVGINALVVLLDRRTQFHGEALTATQTSANPATRELLDNVSRFWARKDLPKP